MIARSSDERSDWSNTCGPTLGRTARPGEPARVRTLRFDRDLPIAAIVAALVARSYSVSQSTVRRGIQVRARFAAHCEGFQPLSGMFERIARYRIIGSRAYRPRFARRTTALAQDC